MRLWIVQIGNRESSVVANALTNKNQGIAEFDIMEYPLPSTISLVIQRNRRQGRTERGMKISNTFNPSSETAQSGGG